MDARTTMIRFFVGENIEYAASLTTVDALLVLLAALADGKSVLFSFKDVRFLVLIGLGRKLVRLDPPRITMMQSSR